MAGTVIKDTLTTLEMHEQNGVIWTLRRELLVHAITDSDGASLSDFRVLKEALDACTAEGFGPKTSPEATYGDLILVERIPSLVGGQQAKVRVELVYEQAGSSLDSLPLETYLFSGSSSLAQSSTDVDRLGNRIFVSYDHPAGNRRDESQNLVGWREFQADRIQVDAPNDLMVITGRIAMTQTGPMDEAQQIRGHVNAAIWRGGAPGTWLCTSVEYELYHLLSIAPPRPIWTFTWTFQFDPAGWQPWVFFRDPATGKLPSNLVPGQGFYQVDWFPTHTFHRFPD